MKNKKSIAILMAAITLASCQSYKKVPYLQSYESLTDKSYKEIVINEVNQQDTLYDARIQPKDLLNITINTTDPQAASTVVGAAYEPFAYSGCKFPDNHNDRHGAVDVAALHDERHIVGRLAVHIHQCGVRHGADVCRCGVHFYPDRFCGNHSADSDRRSGSDDTDELLCHVLHG